MNARSKARWPASIKPLQSRVRFATTGAMVDTIASPCRNICRLSADGMLCEGCGRTLDEIGRWTAASDAEKRRIVAAARERLMGPAPPHVGGK